jgi:hypothetical protein
MVSFILNKQAYWRQGEPVHAQPVKVGLIPVKYKCLVPLFNGALDNQAGRRILVTRFCRKLR